MHITGWAGEARGIDPGRPGVPEFGRRLYNLSLPRNRLPRGTRTSVAPDAVAIERKAGLPIELLSVRGDLEMWRKALIEFTGGIVAAEFSAVICDHDGTLVDTRERYFPPPQEIARELLRLLEAGLVIGIATGRGASVRRDLQACLPRSLWEQLIIGYYNGAEIGFLADDSVPDGTEETCVGLQDISEALRSQSELSEVAKQTDRRYQITLEPTQAVPENRLWDIVNQVIYMSRLQGIGVVRSGHSVDILAPTVSKLNLVKHISETFGDE